MHVEGEDWLAGLFGKKRSIDDGFISNPPGHGMGMVYGYGKSRDSFPLGCLLAPASLRKHALILCFYTGLVKKRLARKYIEGL